ncbi:hypothetical protein ACA910_013123 [Epithemia clementina (nom. ined.)]
MAAHQCSRFSWEQLVGPEESTAIFIQGSPNEEDALTVFASLILPGTKISDAAWAKIELTPRPLISWQTVFQLLLKQEEPLGKDPIAKVVLFKDSKAAMKFAYTPRKRLSSQVQGAASSSAQVKLVPIEKDLGDKPSPAVAKMTTSGMWRSLMSNVETINKNVSQLSEHMRK